MKWANNNSRGRFDDYVLRDIIYSRRFNAYLSFAGRALAAAYLLRSREVLAELCLCSGNVVGGETVILDETRVAKKAMCNIHVLVRKTLVQAAIQILSDQPAVQEPQAAMDKAEDVIMVANEGRPKKGLQPRP